MRFRHLDNDIVRAARQQDFLRAGEHAAERRSSLLSNLHPLARLVREEPPSTDENLQTSRGILRLAAARGSSARASRCAR